MAIDKKFDIAVPDGPQEEKKLTQLTELQKSDPNTIYNLIFAKEPAKQDEKKA